jgi:hypothetical protein
MTSRNGKVFIDANIINFAVTYQKSDILGWLDELYDTLYIHSEVLAEILIGSNKRIVLERMDKGKWILFDSSDPRQITDDEFPIYERIVKYIEQGFKRLDEKKKLQGRSVKGTSDRGEIHSLAAAIFLSAGYICSNDYDIREVIQDEQLLVGPDEALAPELIVQDTIEDLCFLCVKENISTKREVRQFFKFVYNQDPDHKRQIKLEALDTRISMLREE